MKGETGMGKILDTVSTILIMVGILVHAVSSLCVVVAYLVYRVGPHR